jgi:hypothetical protein
LPSISGYTSPSQVEAEAFAEECVAWVSGGNAEKIMEQFDPLYFIQTSSGKIGDKPASEMSAAEYREFDALQRELWQAQLKMLAEPTKCKFRQIEPHNGGQQITLETAGKLAGTSVPILLIIETINKKDGTLVVYQMNLDHVKR